MTSRGAAGWRATLAASIGLMLASGFAIAGGITPLNDAEREHLADWRSIDRRLPPAMSSAPFVVPADSSAPVDSISVENTSSRILRNFWFHRADMPNFYSAQTIVDTVAGDKATQTDKAVALWELFPKYYYNYYPLRFGGMLQEPTTLLAVLGTAQCNYAATALESLCQLAGMQTRTVGLGCDSVHPRIAHCTMEAKADGRWIFMDPDGHAIFHLPDGRLAGVEDLMADASPVINDPRGTYPPQAFAQVFGPKGERHFYEHTDDPWRYADRFRNPARFLAYHHYMRFDLLPGTRVTLYPDRVGRCLEQPLPLSASGVMKWTLKPENVALGAAGLRLYNATATLRGSDVVLRRVAVNRPAALEIPLVNPYLMVGGRIVVNAESMEPTGVSIMPFSRSAQIDPGWQRLGDLTSGDLSSAFDRAFLNDALFGYALKIEVPSSGLTLRSLEVLTHLQCAPKALPALDEGNNLFYLYSERSAATPPIVEQGGDSIAVAFERGLRVTFTQRRMPVAAAPQTHGRAAE